MNWRSAVAGIPASAGSGVPQKRSPAAPGSSNVKETNEESKLRKAAEDFEGLLISQMLQSIRESALGGWQENHDQAGAVALEMAETQLAQVMASQGGLGIARTLQASMKMRNRDMENSSSPGLSISSGTNGREPSGSGS